MTRRMPLNLFIQSQHHHEASWRHPNSSPLALTDIHSSQDIARRAEAGLFDSIFLADQLAMGEDGVGLSRAHLARARSPCWPRSRRRPRIGLIATASTRTTSRSTSPASSPRSTTSATAGRMEHRHVGAGEARTTASTQVPRRPLCSAPRVLEVAQSLWDSWADDAVLDERPGTTPTPTGSARSITRRALPGARAAQHAAPSAGPPGAVQAGSSEAGRRFAARCAEAVFTAQQRRRRHRRSTPT